MYRKCALQIPRGTEEAAQQLKEEEDNDEKTLQKNIAPQQKS